MRTSIQSLAAWLLIILLQGCGGNAAISPAERDRIDRVSVQSPVKIPAKAGMFATTKELGSLFGAVGTAATSSVPVEDALDAALKGLNFDLAAFVGDEFNRQLGRSAYYGAKLSPDAPYRFVVEVPTYGISHKFAFSSKWWVLMRIDYKLVAPDGRVLAADWKMTKQFGDNIEVSEEEVQKNPEVLRQAFEKAVVKLVGQLLENGNL